MRQFFGKYRGKVENNLDPEQLGRLQVSVPTVFGEGRSNWAIPCVPYAGAGVGLFAIPPNGANLWVEFEGGDPDYPIWTGCFWGKGEAPVLPAVAEMKVWKTDVGAITFNDLPGGGGITIETTAGMKIAISSLGIEITNGQSTIQLTGPQVSVNNGALEVS